MEQQNEKIMKYECTFPKEPLVLEPEDWTEAEWATILKLFGMEKADRIVISHYMHESYGIRKERKNG